MSLLILYFLFFAGSFDAKGKAIALEPTEIDSINHFTSAPRVTEFTHNSTYANHIEPDSDITNICSPTIVQNCGIQKNPVDQHVYSRSATTYSEGN